MNVFAVFLATLSILVYYSLTEFWMQIVFAVFFGVAMGKEKNILIYIFDFYLMPVLSWIQLSDHEICVIVNIKRTISER
jgi:hypothetical protein